MSEKKETQMKYRLVCGDTSRMMPHVPTEEMVANHPWHVYKGNQLLFTGTKAECKAVYPELKEQQ